MELYLIRHGESIGNTKEGFISGRTDTDGLTTKGRTQIIRLAWEIRQRNLTQILTSPIPRAKDSAKILAKLTRTPLFTRKALTELDHGILENRYWWDVKDRISKEWKQRRDRKPEENFVMPYPRGESFRQVTDRTWQLTNLITNKYKDKDIIVVISHQIILAAITYRLQFGPKPPDPKKFMAFIHQSRFPNGSGVRFTLKNDQTEIESLPNLLPTAKYDLNNISYYIRGNFGWVKHPRVTQISTVSQNQVYLIKNREKAIFKLLSDRESLTIRRIVELYNYLQAKKISTPRVIYQDRSRIFFKDDVLVQDYQKGVNQNICINKHLESVPNLFQNIYSTIKRIHALNIAAVSSFWYPDDWTDRAHPNWKTYFSTEIDKTLRKLDEINLSTNIMKNVKTDLTALRKFVRSNSYQLVPLHGDFSPNNIIVRHQKNRCRLVRVIDFERARIGDPVWDFSYYYGWLERFNRELAEKWRQVFWVDFTKIQQTTFWLYRVLFHTWSIRDRFDYVQDTKRARLADQSFEVLRANQCPL